MEAFIAELMTMFPGEINMELTFSDTPGEEDVEVTLFYQGDRHIGSWIGDPDSGHGVTFG